MGERIVLAVGSEGGRILISLNLVGDVCVCVCVCVCVYKCI